MARMYGSSGSTKYLLNGTKPINGKRLSTLEEIDDFYYNYETILNETERAVTNRQDEIILRLTNDELRFNGQYKAGISNRTKEVDGELNELRHKIEVEAHKGFFIKLRYRFQYFIGISFRSHRIHSPYAGVLRELVKVQSQKADRIAIKHHIIRLERNKVIETYTFLKNNKPCLIGAHGVEQVIKMLSQLPDDYHIFNDVNLRFDPPIHWRERDESIITSQIDHIVVGPTGVFSLETKNWKLSDFNARFAKLEYQVRRSSLSLWYYLKHHYHRDETPKIRNVVVSLQGSHPTGKVGKYIDIVSLNHLCGYIINKKPIISNDAMNKVIDLISIKVGVI